MTAGCAFTYAQGSALALSQIEAAHNVPFMTEREDRQHFSCSYGDMKEFGTAADSFSDVVVRVWTV